MLKTTPPAEQSLTSPADLHLSHRPQLGLTSAGFQKDYQQEDWGGVRTACSAPTDCNTYLMQTPGVFTRPDKNQYAGG